MSYIKYDEYDLLDLFECEPVVVAEKETGIFLYNTEDSLGFKLSLYLSLYEQICIVSLEYQNFVKPILDMKFEGVHSIIVKDGKLKIRQKEVQHDVVVYFVPNYAIACEEQSN